MNRRQFASAAAVATVATLPAAALAGRTRNAVVVDELRTAATSYLDAARRMKRSETSEDADAARDAELELEAVMRERNVAVIVSRELGVFTLSAPESPHADGSADVGLDVAILPIAAVVLLD